MEDVFSGLKDFAEALFEKSAEAQRNEDMLEDARDKVAMEIRTIEGVPHRWDWDRRMWTPMEIPLPRDEVRPDSLEFFTLAGIVDYINANNEGLIPTDGSRIILQVVDQNSVQLLSLPSECRRDRCVIAQACAHVPEIVFGRYMDTDTFNTMLLSQFVETEARKLLFSVVKSMTQQQTAQTTDDGVGQVITVKEGVSLASNVTFQNPVPLRPRRTFTEVEQPESNFTLRVDKEANAALFESDGGAWKNEAVARIREYLAANIENPAVIVIA